MASAALRPSDQTYSIRQLCREFEVTPRALRFYEDRGLLTPSREGLTRVYGARERVRVQLIVQGKRVGFGLDEIGEMLDLYDRNDGGAVQMAVSLEKFRARIKALERQRRDIDSAIQALEDGCVWLAERLSGVDGEHVRGRHDAGAVPSHDQPLGSMEV